MAHMTETSLNLHVHRITRTISSFPQQHAVLTVQITGCPSHSVDNRQQNLPATQPGTSTTFQIQCVWRDLSNYFFQLSRPGKCLNHSPVRKSFLSKLSFQRLYRTFVLLMVRILSALRPRIKILTTQMKITSSDHTTVRSLLKTCQLVIWDRCILSNKENLYPSYI